MMKQERNLIGTRAPQYEMRIGRKKGGGSDIAPLRYEGPVPLQQDATAVTVTGIDTDSNMEGPSMKKVLFMASLVVFAFLLPLLASAAAKDDVVLYALSFSQGEDYGCPCDTSSAPWILKNTGERTVVVTVVLEREFRTWGATEYEVLAGDTKCLGCQKDGTHLQITGARYK